MEKSFTEKILNDLESVKRMLHQFQEEERIPSIEKDIILSRLRELYEMVLLPGNKHEMVPGTAEPIVTSHEELQESVLEIEPEIKNKSEIISETESLIEREAPVSMPVETANQEKKEGIKAEEQEIRFKEKEEIKIPHTAPKKPLQSIKKEILADRFQKQGFLNEALAQYQNMMDLSKKIQNQPLKDISAAISFNEKFLFIKELFDSDGALYQSTIEKINHAESFNDAIKYLDENFDWDFNDAQVQKLLELIRRRFLNH